MFSIACIWGQCMHPTTLFLSFKILCCVSVRKMYGINYRFRLCLSSEHSRNKSTTGLKWRLFSSSFWSDSTSIFFCYYKKKINFVTTQKNCELLRFGSFFKKPVSTACQQDSLTDLQYVHWKKCLMELRRASLSWAEC